MGKGPRERRSVLSSIVDYFRGIGKDFREYDCFNSDPQRVFDSTLFSCFLNTFVLKLPIGCNAASFGIIFLGSKIKDAETLYHEFGHRLQLRRMGFFRYLFNVFIPSVTENIIQRFNKLPYDYYGSPWEHEADCLGGVERTVQPWPEHAYCGYLDLLRMLFQKM